MKKLPEDFRKTDGFKLLKMTFRCKLGEAPIIKSHEMKVVFRSGITHGPGSDFVGDNNSCRSKDCFEIGGATVSTGVAVDWDLTGYLYCLPENAELARAAFKVSALSELHRRLGFLTRNMRLVYSSIKGIDNTPESLEKEFKEQLECKVTHWMPAPTNPTKTSKKIKQCAIGVVPNCTTCRYFYNITSKVICSSCSNYSNYEYRKYE